MPELGTSGSAGGPGRATARVYPTQRERGTARPHPNPLPEERGTALTLPSPRGRGERACPCSRWERAGLKARYSLSLWGG